MSSRKSNREICEYYKDKNRDELTLKYFFTVWDKGKGKKDNPYLQLYEDFCSKKFARRKDNKSLYRVLEAWKYPEKASFPIDVYSEFEGSKENKKIVKTGEIHDASELPDFEFLRNIDIDILNPYKNRGGEANQKWHLYVAVFAYRVVCEGNFDWDKWFPLYRCHVLRLWMIENAEGQEAVLKEIEEKIDGNEDVNKLIDDAFNSIFKGE